MKFLKLLFSRMSITGILILAQIAAITYLVLNFAEQFAIVYGIIYVFNICMIIYILNKRGSSTFKLPWIIIMMVLPIFGAILYIMLGRNKPTKKMMEKVKVIIRKNKEAVKENKDVYADLLLDDKMMYNQSQYIFKSTYMPVYRNTSTKYLKIGEEYIEELLKELKKAKKFIFLEYFIVEEGKMLDSIIEVLKEKVKQGVEVRVMYDDLGSIMTIRDDYPKYLESLGIKCQVFNPFVPIFSIIHNNRDHRKIAVIDGKVGFTGGLNLADEYINEKVVHGHWKDTGIKLKGDAVRSLTSLFLESWNFYRPEDRSYLKFMPELDESELKEDGYVQPFGENPLDKEMVAQTIYMNIINQSEDYVYINTPYLIVDTDIIGALIAAAKRGVDVRITTPHIADKWYVHIVTRSQYEELIEAGVKIYEYKPGFIHAKSFVCDDKLAVIGTINLDYRSLVHHFECGVWLYKNSAIKDMKKDYLETQKKCIKITKKFCKDIKWYNKLASDLIKIFTPLM